MDLKDLEAKAKAEGTRILDGTKAEVGKGVAWYDSHKAFAIGAGIIFAVLFASYYICHAPTL